MRRVSYTLRWFFIAVTVVTLAAVPALAQVSAPATTTAEAIDQAVVLVNVAHENRGRVTRGSGSGVIVDQTGIILTAAHVVLRATYVQVKLRSGEVLPTRVVGVDPVYDVALLQVESRTFLPVVSLGNSSRLRRGEAVTAFGRSPDRRTEPTAGEFLEQSFEIRPGTPVLLTTAVAFPGDSGGALIDARGELVGIIGAINDEGTMSLSIAIDAIKEVYSDLLAGMVRHPWMGIRGETITDALAQELGLPVRSGILVLEVIEGSPAALAGLVGGQAAGFSAAPRGGDLITSVDGRPVRSFGQLAAYVLSKRIGDPINLEVLRDGRMLTLTLILADRPNL